MRTTINVDDSIFEDILSLTGAKTKTEAVNRALEDYVRMKRIKALISLFGKVEIEENYRELREMDRYERWKK